MTSNRQVSAGQNGSSVVMTKGYVEVSPNQHHAHDIIPYSSDELDRDILIGSGSTVAGSVYGKNITIAAGHSSQDDHKTSVFGLFAENNVTLGNYCNVDTHVQALGDVSVGNECSIYGDVIAGKVNLISDGSKILGNVIAEGDINIGKNVFIGGYVVSINGGIAINKDSTAYDLSAKRNIEIDANVTVKDKAILSSGGNIVRLGDVSLDERNMSVVNDSVQGLEEIRDQIFKENCLNLNHSVYLDLEYDKQQSELNESLLELKLPSS